jgi:glycosyltransferase involved in cell wall biosynthesis
VYGFVDADSGSLASANYLLLDELLRRGHRIDFYAIAGFVRPRSLEGRPGYRYCPLEIKPLTAAWRLLTGVARGALRAPAMFGLAQVSNYFYHRAIGRAIRRAHAARPYDALLVLGLLSPFRVDPSLRVVSWTQGTPTGELEAIRRQRSNIRRYGGRVLYAGLTAFYRSRIWQTRHQIRTGGTILCGSRWAAASWAGLGAPPGAVVPIPYPLDTERLRPVERHNADPDAVTFLHLGRIVPRKRLDLLLEAFQLFRREFPRARLLVVGRFSYARGYERLLHDPALGQNVEYRPAIPRAQVPDLFSRVDIVIQPSENENFGSAPVEAQSCGLPVILGPTNGTRDYIAPSSRVFAEYTPEAVADAMRRAAEDVRTRRAELAADTRATAVRHLAVPAVVDRLMAILHRTAPTPAVP